MEETFLGIEDGRYTGGRLENYTEVDAFLIHKICDVLDRFSDIIAKDISLTPYDLAIKLEDTKEELWDKE